jgi:inositol 1,4,5-triphosphate receptor type 1
MHKVFMMMYSAEYLTLIDQKLSRTRRVYNRVAYFLGHNVLYYSLYTAFAVLGVTTHEFFFAFHLYEIMNQFKTCRIFIKSITDPYKQLLLAFVYYCFLIYAYSVIGYLFFWRYFVNTSDGPPADVQHYCNTLWMCFLTIYDQTNKEPGGIGSFLDFFGDLPVITNGYRVLFDVTFRFVIPIVMLSIVKGIIVDTFGALREKDQAQLDDKASRCFMCGLEKYLLFIIETHSTRSVQRHSPSTSETVTTCGTTYTS